MRGRDVPLSLLSSLLVRSDRHQLRTVLENRFGGSFLLTGSGTQALQAAITVAGGRNGSSPSVALPAYGCFDLVSAAVGAKADVWFYDVDPDSLGPDGPSLSRALEAGVGSVVIAPVYGHYVGWEGIVSKVRGYGSVVIEDAAQSFGTTVDGKPAGSLGDLSVLSFGRGKGWSGLGGGALRMDKASESVPALDPATPWVKGAPRFAAVGAAVSLLSFPVTFRILQSIALLGLGETRYHRPVTPREIGAPNAALARRALDIADQAIADQRENAACYAGALRNNPDVAGFEVDSGCVPGALRRPVLARTPRGAQILEGLHGLGVRRAYPRVLSGLEAIGAFCMNRNEAFEGAQFLVDHLYTVPTHARLRPSDLKVLAEELASPGSRPMP